ncbi:DUF106 domain-containing protein [Candidatus Pacearchaeota archaeon]|nr:DUF106 domain-containing protein [Candidatus Pacearchaeota archaeon]
MVFTEILQKYPEASIIVLATAVSLISILITKYFTNQNRMKELKARQKELSKLSKEFRTDIKKVTEINKEIMELTMEMMKHSLKPMIITLIPLLLLFWWVGQTFSTVLPKWIWYYIIAGIASSLIFRKLLKVV